MSVENLITEHLDIWTSAIKSKPSSGRGSSKKMELVGVKKLRELILELAVRGKLVPQDPNDEPASELLKKIEAEKVRLLSEGKIKKQKPLPQIKKEEKPFELPNEWEWARFGDCVSLRSGSSFGIERELDSGEVPYCKVGDMNMLENICNLTTSSRFINPTRKDLNQIIPKNSIAFPKRGGAIATNKKRYIHKALFVDLNVMTVTPYKPISLNFVMTWLNGIDLALLNTGTSVPQINNKDIEPLLFPIPPIEEQHRIVAKVDELMALCDQLEAQTESSIDAHKTLVEVLLATLTDAKDADELNDNWQTISQHFDVLFTTQASIDQLKQTILQLAVMGKLVKQDPNDEPASKLLERIATEKQQLIKDGKIKKQKPLPPITDEEKPLELPEEWGCIRLGEVINLVSGQHLKPDEYSESSLVGGVPYITGPAEFGDINPTYSKYTIEKRALAQPNDILVTCKGAGLGKLNVADEIVAISRQLMAVQPVKVNASFLKLIINSLYSYFQSMGVGIAIPGISREHVTDIVIKLPPTLEQNRIVAKVDELMALCESLKANLDEAQTTQLHLKDAVIENALTT
jgi:type I restriction enzyme S subunit